ncbi:MAG: toll/interleukin-1 receptor domain-containing protein [Eubacterium sp.]|nr:toll/interleukin-1 receptor domain-containing protein [Eubacterium sp.]
MKYEAFISYRHGGIDGKVAARVQQIIEKYRIPSGIVKRVGKKRIGRVFRDSDELQAGSDLSALIREGLDEAEWLIVIASKRYNESVWCLEEIEYFLQIRGREKVLVILVDGEPNESFPKALTEIERDGEMVSIEPLAVDVRGGSESEVMKTLHRERFRFLSSMLGVSYEDLRQRQRERTLRRAVAMIGTAFVVLGVVIGVIVFKNIQLNEAYVALDYSNQETLRGESYYLSEYADEAFADGDRRTAMMLALEAMPEDMENPDRPYVPRAMRSLTQALGVYDYTAGFRTKAFFETDGETYDVRTMLNDNGDRILIESYYYAAGNLLDRNVRVVTMEGKELVSFGESSINLSAYHAGSRGAILSADGEKLLYLGEDGLRCVRIDSGEEVFSGDPADELIVSPDGKTIATIDYENGRLKTYDDNGVAVINCDLGQEMNFMLEQISPDSREIALTANTEEVFGIVTIELSTGQSGFISMPGPCSFVRYIDNDRLCFLLSDPGDGLKHIVKYDKKIGDQGYLCNADWDMQTITLTDRESCYYYHENTVYEVDCNSKKGKNKWEYVFPSEVVSVGYGEGVLGVSCRDGSVSFFEEAGKRKIHAESGGRNPAYLLDVKKDIVTSRDYWGRNVRVYENNTNKSSSSGLADVTSLVLDSDEQKPEKWYTCTTNGECVALSFHNGAVDKLSVFNTEDMTKSAGRTLQDMGYGSIENKTVDVRNSSYVSVEDFDSYRVTHFLSEDLREVYSFDENDGYYYYSEDGETLWLSQKGKMSVIDAISGETVSEESLPAGMNRGVEMTDNYVFGNDNEVLIRNRNGEDAARIPDSVLYACNRDRDLIVVRDAEGRNCRVIRVSDQKVLCDDESGIYSNSTFFGDNKYFLMDYQVVYDMDTWEQVLDLSDISSSVYGVQTCQDIPYFVVWCREDDSSVRGGTGGTNIAYLYEKDGSGEIVGDIPNFVTLSPSGEAVVFDGEDTLYRFPLLTVDEVKSRAFGLVGNDEFTDEQREKYHLFVR